LNKKRGIIYSATGDRFLNEAIISSRSFKKHHDLPLTIYTDIFNKEKAEKYFDDIRIINNPNYSFLDKIGPLIDPPYEENLFLDSDTYFLENISSLYDILDTYSLAVCRAIGRIQFPIDVPDWFPELNTGLILFTKNKRIREIFIKWKELYLNQISLEKGIPHDQPSFRKILFESKLPVYIIPNEFNFRTVSPNFAGRNFSVKVLHGRHRKFEQVGRIVNKNPEIVRLFINDYRFLMNKNFTSLNPRQNERTIFKLLIKVIPFIAKIFFRLGLVRSDSIQKRKGHPKY